MRICNQWVAGSTPVTSSKKSYDIPLKSGVCRGAFAFMSPTASPPFRKIMPPGGARVLKSAHHDAAVVFGGVALSGAFAPRPGCGSQRLLRCRSHPAGRGPNSSSLFPPLAAVVAVAPRGGAAGVSVRSAQDERSSDWSKTIVPRYRGQRSTSFCDMRNLSGQLRVARLANGSPFGRAGAPAPERAISASR